MTQALKTFTIETAEDGYLLRIEGEGGEMLELTASFDQLDVVAEAIDRCLDANEEEDLATDAAG